MKVGEYRINRPESIETPEFLVFEDMVNFNIDAVIKIIKGSKDTPYLK